MARIKYPIGIQTFRDIISDGYLYVDKTQDVYDITDRYRYVFLSRPRRFGKSLLVSTLESYFKGEKELFKGLAIEKLEKEWKRYPVFRFDFSPANFSESSSFIKNVNFMLDELENQYSIKSSSDIITERLLELIRMAYKKYKQKVVVLIDDYDMPTFQFNQNEFLKDKISSELDAFYTVLKSSDEYIRFVMLTGTTKYVNNPIFKGLNNLKDISDIPRYKDICGGIEGIVKEWKMINCNSFPQI